MKQDIWTHTTTKNEYGTNGAMGSPRAWLRRVLDMASSDDTVFQPGSLTPTEISVAGIWYKTPDLRLPQTAHHRELFRWFELPAPPHILQRSTFRRTGPELLPVIGMCAAVPMHEVIKWVRTYQDSGAAYTWWNTPKDQSQRAADPGAGKPQRRQLDHDEIYQMLAAGRTAVEIARQLGCPRENIDYVVKKWRAGVPQGVKWGKPKINAAALLSERTAGASAAELADKYNTTQAYVFKLLKQEKNKLWQDLNQP